MNLSVIGGGCLQTFLSYADFADSAHCLDRSRLGKQRVEVLQILRALNVGGSWSNHPAVLMWRGYEVALAVYEMFICVEWTSRGYRDSCLEKIMAEVDPSRQSLIVPWRNFSDELYASHRSNLLRKMPQHYGTFRWTEPDDLPYFWPTKESKCCSTIRENTFLHS